MSNIGIMDPAFFVGKNVLLAWLNDFFSAGFTKVEQMATGSMACQIFDAIYPGKVALNKVNFDAKTQPESVANFKVLQSIFDKEQISKYIDVTKLLNGKFQDNLEFLQWLKSYFDKNYGGQEYNAVERRDWARSQYKKGHKFAGVGAASSATRAPTVPKPAASVSKVAASVVAAKPKPAAATRAAPVTRAAATRKTPPIAGRATAAESEDSQSALLVTMQATMEGLEKERGFYFGKLREIEILCQDDSNEPIDAGKLKQQILDILYQTDDNAEFQSPEDEAALAASELDLNGDIEADGAEAGLLDNEELTETY